ncbi:MAG: starch-binding protein [Ruminococcus sp.]|nr:starch-binding protein [Ruminococcus sp.]
MSKKITSIILCLSMMLSCLVISGFTTQAVTLNSESVSASTDSESVSAKDYGLADNVQNGVILHCWNWSYNNIKKYLPQIAEAGYTAVQTSPVTQPKDYYWEGVAYGNVGIPDGIGGTDGNWWKSYQPVTESLCDNGYTWYGTKAEFKSMCDEAEKYGIKVIVDIVANHMGNIKGYKIGSVEEVMGDISPQVGQFWNPAMLTDSSYWHISTSWTHSSDGRFDVTQGNMGMPDLNTGDSKVQNMILNLLKECIDNGADGFRFDAAKHIETPADDPAFASNFWDVVLDGATSYAKSTKNFTPYYYGEVLNRIDSNAAENYYLSKMSVTDNSTGDNIRNTLKYGGIGGAANSGYCGYAHGQGNKVVLWAESHDTYMGGGSSYDCNDSTINKAWAIVASRKDSTGLYLARPYYSYERLIDDQNGYDARKDPNQMAKEIRQTQMGEVGTLTWMDTCVAEVNRFRNHFIGQSESLGSTGDSLFYNVRGNSGVVLVSSKGPCDVSLNLQGKMKDGTYTDQVTGNKFTVSGGTIKGSIKNSDGIAVIYNANTVPRNTIEAPRENFATETAEITVGLSNATSGTYSINGASPITFTKDTTLTIGAGDAVGTEYVITLTATDGTNNTSSTFTFTKESKTVSYPTEPGYTTVPATTQPTTAKPTTQPATTAPPTQPQEQLLIGDVNFDNKITVDDATNIQKYLVDLLDFSEKARLVADVDSLGDINITDVTLIMFYVAGMTDRSGNCGKYIGGVDPTTPSTEPSTTQPSDNYIYAKGYTHAYFWSDSQKDIGGKWPGIAMESIGNNVYRVVIPAGATKVVFSNGGSGQTADLIIPGADKIYDNGTWKNYGDQDETQPSDGYIYAKGYTHAYFWSDSQTDIGGKWPGIAMESVGNNVYRIAIPTGATKVIFSYGGNNQTDNLTIPGTDKIYENGTWSSYN